ncbi:hypothetical protein ACVIRO_002386 [Rhizobium ruizarguesonis]
MINPITARGQYLAAQHQLSSAERYGDAQYYLRHLDIRTAEEKAIEHQRWAARYAEYSREQLGISDTEDQLYA